MDALGEFFERLDYWTSPVVLHRLLNRVLEGEGESEGSRVGDLCVLIFYTRAFRGNKGLGDRELFRRLFVLLYSVRPAVALAVAPLIPVYGSWHDVFLIALVAPAELRTALLKLAIAEMCNDRAIPDGEPISLCAKWAPREGKAFGWLAREMADLLTPYPHIPVATRRAQYRRLVARLNQRLGTVETLMSAGRWADIAPESVPKRAKALYARAFLNVVNRAEAMERVRAGCVSQPTDMIRRPNDPDRVACGERFAEYFSRPYPRVGFGAGVSPVSATPTPTLADVLADPHYDSIRERVCVLLPRKTSPV